MSHNHPTFETLTAYAGGALPAGARLVVDVHLSGCDACQRQAADLELVGGALLADAPAASLAPGALDRTLEALDTPAQPAPRLDLQQVIGAGFWVPFGPTLAFKRLSRFADPGERLVLIRVAGGQALPEHGHAGRERLVVLSGSFDDDAGLYGPGDLSERGPADRHQPIARRGETCLCLSATDAPLRLSGLARWLQPATGL